MGSGDIVAVEQQQSVRLADRWPEVGTYAMSLPSFLGYALPWVEVQ